ncbi:hypothetical protein [Paraburkholderia sp. DHOC27]|uniref:hypothetical protein n=1 Tax=Paraburkholderia sp. DHOC27 TaxID=2303330 RepID=UPI000E3BBCBE|nr:hypothetical protein [Paraburkholderia sp. DHOC27]RFU44450.1 hypothetical protein D0B32_27975 [Paraburkholderia sp. DHOC27]
MSDNDSLLLKKALAVLVAGVLAAWFIVGCITTQMAPSVPDASTWHTVPVTRGPAIAYITPPEAWILRISPYGPGLSILLTALVVAVRKARKSCD